jgi:hypothetical protein
MITEQKLKFDNQLFSNSRVSKALILQLPRKNNNNTDLKDTTGPTSLQISISCSSVASYGIFPTAKITK